MARVVVNKNMKTTNYKGKMFSVFVAVDDDRLAQLAKAPEIADAAMTAAANYWHTKVLPKHFEPGAHDKYDYAARSKAYLKKKAGRGPDLVFTGSLQRDLKAKASFMATRKGLGVQLKMSARVLNFAPVMPANSADYYVKIGVKAKGKSYPNLNREIRMLTDQEHDAIADIVTSELERAFAPKQ